MEPEKLTYNQLLSEVEELRFQLEEATDTINAIRTGQVDALIVQGDEGHQLYTLKTADQTYRMFIEKMNEGAVTLNHDGLILYSNSRFAEMVNIPLEKVIGLSFEEFIAEDSRATFNEVFKKAWEAECKKELELIRKDSDVLSCLLSCNTLELDEGLALSLILTDLSIQKNAEKQLKIRNIQLAEAQSATEKLNDELEDTVRDRTADLLISREHFKLLADSIPQMTWTNLQNGEFNFYNQRWYDYTGFDVQQNKATAWSAVLHPDDIQLTTDKFWNALRNGSVFETENRYKRHDGVYRWHLNRAVPLRDDEGKILFWVGTATDIEEQKQQMEKKDEFIGIASHELRTPLTSLKGYLQLIGHKKDALPDGVKPYIDKALNSLNKLQRLVNDLLDVSKIQAGRLEYGLHPVDITELIRLCTENARHVYPTFNIENKSESGLTINGNEERLEQVLMNFINNAVKYSPDSNSIVIKAEKLPDCVRVSVSDKGIGLSPEQKGKIFERFYRVEDKKFMSSGLGMGLYISQEIINNHNGKIGVESQLGIGSTFYFDLPLA
jgi:two-component system phosphate regulon sensor histidine kinase PhoR